MPIEQAIKYFIVYWMLFINISQVLTLLLPPPRLGLCVPATPGCRLIFFLISLWHIHLTAGVQCLVTLQVICDNLYCSKLIHFELKSKILVRSFYRQLGMLLILKSTNLRTAAIALIIMMAQVVASWAKEGVLIGINNTCHSQNKTCF